ncbi:MAG: tetratricopeptide repeat protein [Deltaproteobacteria bacterium]|nr:MAG: tetratricopeptide repeat protein [Deltaproteobacteria bacterium]
MSDEKREEMKEGEKGTSPGSEEKGKEIENLLEMGKFYYVNRKFDEARERFEKVLEIDPDNEEALLNIALIHELHNEPEKAKEVYQTVLKKHPESAAAREKLNRLSGL